MSYDTITSSNRLKSFTPIEPRLAVVSDVTATQLGILHCGEKQLIIPEGEVVILVGWMRFKEDNHTSDSRGYPVVIARGQYGWLYENEVEEI